MVMSSHIIGPYSLIDSTDWSITSLYYNYIKQSQVGGISIGEIAIINKQKFKKDAESTIQQYRYVDITALDIETGMIANAEMVSLENMPNRAKTLARSGDILVSLVRPERGAVAIVPAELDSCVVSNAIAVLTPRSVPSEWLYFILRNQMVCQELSYQAKSTTIPTITLKQLGNYILPINNISPAKATLAKAVYADWEKVLAEYTPLPVLAEEIFKRKLLKQEKNEVDTTPFLIIPYEKLERRWDIEHYFASFQSSPEWSVPSKKLEDFSKFQATVPNYEVCDEFGKILRIKLQNLTENELYIQPEELELEECPVDNKIGDKNNFLQAGDIVLPRVGGKSAKAMVISDSLQGIDVMKQIIVLRTDQRIVSPEYLALYFKTSWGDTQVKACTVGGQSFIQQASLRKMIIPVPAMDVQVQIVQEIKNKTQNIQFVQNRDIIRKFTDNILEES